MEEEAIGGIRPGERKSLQDEKSRGGTEEEEEEEEEEE
jgi:hypothetical protein